MDTVPPSEPNSQFEAILSYLKETRGFDFTGYKRTSLARRVRRRMAQIGVEEFGDYIDLLQVNSEEFGALFNTILINVTSFFRDAEAWSHLREEIVPTLLAERAPDDPVRIWSAGCASGQEAYSLAMVFADALGPERFRQRIKIYATDVDDQALAQARQASYAATDVQNLEPEQIEQYFEQQGNQYVFRKDLRRSVIFGRNDLVQDAPISRIDLLVCRNTLMYFNAETQAKILGRFHFALAPRGLLFLGKAEMLLSHSRIFDPVDLKRRIFRKTPCNPIGLGHLVSQTFVAERQGEVGGLDELREHAFSASPVAQVVVTGEDIVALINQQAEQVFGLSHRDIGRPLRDLEISYRPVELRAYVEQAKVERRALRIKDVEWQRGPGDAVWFEIHINPLVNNDNGLVGVSIVFHDVTAARKLLDELEHTNRQLESAYEELQSTNEELETTNEELQSTVEELETTNEELQSTNEELETMNEELQSTNDELRAINDTLRERSAELDEVKDFLESILSSVRPGVVVVDLEMRILVWNHGAQDLWGLRQDEAAGEHLLNLDIGLPVGELRASVRTAMTDPAFEDTMMLDAVNRRGRQTKIRIAVGALRRPDNGSTQGAILVMEPIENAD
ncbi:PAS domain S-box protein [Kibdelosporangium philippinense]|uniref:protein-glutamate O-methyltransferase n=1 Tax=Kibdelosporangium philippinense TaxID=211113 RepID=A0ABS8Z846_9PSEU|nr:CheR family methyltransferase [Kibdelosporangium philippinense]MCE7003677.1 PAS domain S-box protein [Kibdelosporangium philippinense]